MAIYRITLALLAPFIVLAMLLRWMRGRETRREILERFGIVTATVNGSPVIWVHGASLGEMTAARPLMDRLIAEIDGLKIIATVNTVTARKMIKGWANPAIQVQMAPLDYSIVIRRFCQKWRPVAMITLENELWPNRLLQSQHRDIPVFVVGGRVSARSATRWAKLEALSAKVVDTISFLAPMDQANGDRFIRLGLENGRLGKPVNLKVAVRLPDADGDLLARMKKTFPYAQTFLAASTHEGDEEMILAAFSDALSSNPNIKLILAPRHPDRGDDVSQLIEKRGLSYSRRSHGLDSKSDDTVFLADTVGEMSTWYSLASKTIVGGTFSHRGGHTPVEPIQFNSLVIHGPDVSNHASAFSALSEQNAAIPVETSADIRKVFENCGENPDVEAMKRRAGTAMDELRMQQANIADVVSKIKNATL